MERSRVGTDERGNGDTPSTKLKETNGNNNNNNNNNNLPSQGWNRAGMRPVDKNGRVVPSTGAGVKDAEKEERDILASLDRQSKEFDKDSEIDRIMKAFKLDAYAVLDIHPGVPPSTIKAVYRRKSLLIHPDKTTNPLASEAFDRLAKAHTELMDDVRRGHLDEVISDARSLLIRDLKLTIDSEEVKDPDEDFIAAWREKTKMVLMEDEIRRRRQKRAQMQEEGRERTRLDDEKEHAKLKREHEAEWEQSREKRIESWRGFQKDKARKAEAKKKKSKTKPIG